MHQYEWRVRAACVSYDDSYEHDERAKHYNYGGWLLVGKQNAVFLYFFVSVEKDDEGANGKVDRDR